MPFGQVAASLQFYLFGKRHCTRTGWERASRAYPSPDPLEDPALSLAGKTFMVTGANAGIGREVTRFLASKGATVYMMCRSAARAAAAREAIAQEARCDAAALRLIQCDCSLEADVRRGWREFTELQQQLNPSTPLALHGLVCNAGALLNERTLTSEGVEVTFAAHLLFGTYLLGSLAMPTLEATPGSRLIAVSSGGMYNTKFPAWDVATSTGSTPYDGQFAYAYAKRGQVLLCERWSEMHPKVKVVSCHPGWTLTEGVEAAYGEKKSFLQPLRTLWQGAEGICWLCVAEPSSLQGGEFYLDRTPQPKHLSGPFFSEGNFTKNTPQEVDEMMTRLEQWATPSGRPAVAVMQESVRRYRLQRPLQAMPKPLDLQVFMGKWYVLANIPLYVEQGATNCVENYAWNEERGGVDVLFEYLPKGAAPSSRLSSASMRARVLNPGVGTHWALNPKVLGVHLPLGLDYLILYVDPEQRYCIVGEPKRQNLWIMTRARPQPSKGGKEALQAALAAASAEGSAKEAGAAVSVTAAAGVSVTAGGAAAVMGAEEEASILREALGRAKEDGYDVSKVLRVQWS